VKRLQTILPLIFAWIAVALGASAKQDSLKTYTLPPVYVIVEKPSEAIGSLYTINSEDVINSLSLREAMQKKRWHQRYDWDKRRKQFTFTGFPKKRN